MKSKGIHTGLVAIFDILGYRAINEYNEIEMIAEMVSDVLVGLPHKVKDCLNSILTRMSRLLTSLPEKTEGYVTALLLSDSILLSPVETSPRSSDKELFTWLIFILYCRVLWIRDVQSGPSKEKFPQTG